MEIISQSEQDSDFTPTIDFTPTVEKMFILFAQFGKLSQMLVYPLQYIPLGTDLTQFDTFPIHNKKKDERTPSL